MSKAVSARETRRGSRPRRDRLGFTLVEVLVATGLTLMLMAAIAGIFALVSENIAGARATIEMTERLRATQLTLQNDLAGATARGLPPLDPAEGRGYTEIIEGPVGPCGPPDTILVKDGIPVADTPAAQVRNLNETYADGVTWDTTVGDYDDVLMFTTRSNKTPFTGRGPVFVNGNLQNSEAQSNVAEVAWFLRGRTLYRRVLLVDPTYDASGYTNNGVWSGGTQSYYGLSDISVRQVGGTLDPTTTAPAHLVANSLGDLTKRENRFAHPPLIADTGVSPLKTSWPHDARFWGGMRLPTLRECSDVNWPLPFYANNASTVNLAAGVIVPSGFPIHTDATTFQQFPAIYFPLANRVRYDAWNDPRQWDGLDVSSGSIVDTSATTTPGSAGAPLLYKGNRYADDVILTNVVGFDVKVWDPGAPIFQKSMLIGVGSSSTQMATVGPGDAGYFESLQVLYNDASDGNTDPANRPITYGAFVDLGWAVNPTAPTSSTLLYPGGWVPPIGKVPQFHSLGNYASALAGWRSDQTANNPLPDYRARIYDTGSSHYERDGVDQGVVGGMRGNAVDGVIDPATDGLDNNSLGGIDDATEREAPPPYDAELKAIQVKIRVFEPDSRQIREVTVVQEFIAQ